MINSKQEQILSDFFINKCHLTDHPLKENNDVLIAKRESGMSWKALKIIFTRGVK